MKAERAADAEMNISRKLILQEKVTQAQKAYHATPRGQNELTRTIALLITETKTDPTKLNEITALKISLRDGEITRTNQLAAYAVAKEKKQSNVKEVLQTGNKQELAVGITFQHFMTKFEKTHHVDAHILSKDVMEVRNVAGKELFKILCIQQKYQAVFDVAKTTDTGLALTGDQPNNVDVEAVQKALQAYEIFTNLPPESAAVLQGWVIAKLVEQNILFVSSVDVRTENIELLPIENLFDMYTLNFKKKKKLGGTSAYRFGDSSELKAELKNTIFENVDITLVTSGSSKHTYLVNAPIANRADVHTEHFFFAAHRTEEAEIYYEVRVRHLSSQLNIFLSLNRTHKVLPVTNLASIEAVLSEHAFILS